jgi:hypothetical protein
MGPGHPHHPYGPHGFHGPHGFSGPHDAGGGLTGLWPLVPTVLLALLVLAVLIRGAGVAPLAAGVASRLRAGPRAGWRTAMAGHREIAAAFAAYECDPQAVLRRPALADVRQPATAGFVEAFAEACALATDRYPGRATADAFVVAAGRASQAWTAATEAAGRLPHVQFAPGERALLEETAALLDLARRTPHDGERAAAYVRAAQRLAELERLSGWVLPQNAAAVLRHHARRALISAPARPAIPAPGARTAPASHG